MVTNAAEARNFFVTNKTSTKARPSLLSAPANAGSLSNTAATASAGGQSVQHVGGAPVVVKSALKRGRKEAFGEESGASAADRYFLLLLLFCNVHVDGYLFCIFRVLNGSSTSFLHIQHPTYFCVAFFKLLLRFF